MASTLTTLQLMQPRRRVLQPQRSQILQPVHSNCRLTLPGKETGKLIKRGRLNQRLRSSANRRPAVGCPILLFRTRSLSPSIRERSASVYGETPAIRPPSQPPTPRCLKLLTYLFRRPRRRHCLGFLKKLPRYRRTDLGLAHRLQLIFISMPTTYPRTPSIILISTACKGKATFSPPE